MRRPDALGGRPTTSMAAVHRGEEDPSCATHPIVNGEGVRDSSALGEVLKSPPPPRTDCAQRIQCRRTQREEAAREPPRYQSFASRSTTCGRRFKHDPVAARRPAGSARPFATVHASSCDSAGAETSKIFPTPSRWPGRQAIAPATTIQQDWPCSFPPTNGRRVAPDHADPRVSAARHCSQSICHP